MEGVEGEAGNFSVTLRQHPRFVDMEACIACGICSEKCPRKIPNEFNMGLNKRKAAYVKYPQAVPLKYAIDKDRCIYFERGKCRACEKLCPTDAIRLDETEKELLVNVGAIILAPGFKAFDPSSLDYYAYLKYPNVVTSAEFERMLSASGPTQGHLERISDRREPDSIAWLQCIGSRDINRAGHNYCSAVCCMYAIKEAVIAKEHSSGDLDTAIFFMDMRTYGKDFERYYNRAKEEHGVRFIRSRVHSILHQDDQLLLKYVAEDGATNQESFDMVVLSVGLETPDSVVRLAGKLNVRVNEHLFCDHSSFAPVSTSRQGIFVSGAFQSPKDIPQAVVEANAAAAAASNLLEPIAAEDSAEASAMEDIDVSGPPRIGVFVCNCGTNIGGVVRVPEVVEYALTLPFVVHSEENLFACSQDAQDKLKEIIREHRLNRMVVAACSPRTHEPLFRETLQAARVNKYLFEMANIRDQNSWVHQGDPQAATQKAQDLVRMAVAKAALLEPLDEQRVAIDPKALVVGGGLAGMKAALTIAESGYAVHLVEKSERLGGQANHIHWTWKGEDVQEFRMNLENKVRQHPRITIHLGVEVTDTQGFVGNFKTELRNGESTRTVEHGVAIIATGAKEYKPDEYLYGEHEAVLTHLELDDLFRNNDPRIEQAKNVVFIQCVGSRNDQRPYCSKVCCTHSVKSTLDFKRKNPDVNVAILYRDMRTYGEREDLYREARAAGVLFFTYSLDQKPEVRPDGDRVIVEFTDRILNRKLAVRADILCLASAIVSHWDQSLAQLFKVPLNEDGFFLEAHAKLRPVDFATDGIFICGLAHYPKDIEESLSQSMAAAARAVSVLAQRIWVSSGLVAHINTATCVGCQGCLNVCPYGVIDYFEDKHICGVNIALCKGCGACAAACPSGSASLSGFRPEQINAQISASTRTN